jgi:hypothetical protein
VASDGVATGLLPCADRSDGGVAGGDTGLLPVAVSDEGVSVSAPGRESPLVPQATIANASKSNVET